MPPHGAHFKVMARFYDGVIWKAARPSHFPFLAIAAFWCSVCPPDKVRKLSFPFPKSHVCKGFNPVTLCHKPSHCDEVLRSAEASHIVTPPYKGVTCDGRYGTGF